MYVIISYDVNANKCPKLMKVLRRYLFHIHNSLFEGELTEKQLIELKKEINKVNITDTDRVLIYKFVSNKVMKKEHIGTKKDINVVI